MDAAVDRSLDELYESTQQLKASLEEELRNGEVEAPDYDAEAELEDGRVKHDAANEEERAEAEALEDPEELLDADSGFLKKSTEELSLLDIRKADRVCRLLPRAGLK